MSDIKLGSDTFELGQRCWTWHKSTLMEVEVIEIREPNTVVNWTSADQSKRVYKVRGTQGLARISRKYLVRQGKQLVTKHQLDGELVCEECGLEVGHQPGCHTGGRGETLPVA